MVHFDFAEMGLSLLSTGYRALRIFVALDIVALTCVRCLSNSTPRYFNIFDQGI